VEVKSLPLYQLIKNLFFLSHVPSSQGKGKTRINPKVDWAGLAGF
jgi:hypothetical protein